MKKTAKSQKAIMNREGLISSIAEISGFSKDKTSLAIDGIIKSIIRGLKDGEDVDFFGLGIFRVAQRAATNGRNPRTGRPLKIPAKKFLKFRASKRLRNKIA